MSRANGSPGDELGGLDVAALRRQIISDRAELSKTVEALAAKVDVKAQVQRRLGRGRQRIARLASRVGALVRQPVIGIGGTLALAAAVAFAVATARTRRP
jgi:Protein of unknown function (DUF3618)